MDCQSHSGGDKSSLVRGKLVVKGDNKVEKVETGVIYVFPDNIIVSDDKGYNDYLESRLKKELESN